MHLPLANIVRGDVLLCGASLFLAVRSAGASGLPLLLRIEQASGARHRADVSPDSWTDIAGAGLPMQDIVIRGAAQVRPTAGQRFTKLGSVSKALLVQADRAVARERDAQRFEATAPVRSTLTAFDLVGDRGRKIGRQNAT